MAKQTYLAWLAKPPILDRELINSYFANEALLDAARDPTNRNSSNAYVLPRGSLSNVVTRLWQRGSGRDLRQELLWFSLSTGVGGSGAISLAAYIWGVDEAEAARRLAAYFYLRNGELAFQRLDEGVANE
ncbi:hypothetical protein [Camelimonas lactis]|uniref:Uncharacterized protein n=1 Tax=Camelimonas lactis TaxID=659006 RepID=A0A4R2GVU9_9HYPH|nr:hypothetical protein [Camelimonas lactis]TCO14793.1 hypothetical protein EV666_103303 [Camelimonas lactis]